jgi:uncharacterized protein with PQ loop repeat
MGLHMAPTQIVTLAASTLGLVSHSAQLWRSLRSRSTRTLSLSSFILLTATYSLSLVMGIQYKIGPSQILATLSLVTTVGVLGLISRWVTAAYLALVAGVVAAVLFGPATIGQAVTSTRYAEVVAFLWGLLFAIAFVPQVIKAHRLRDTRDLSATSLMVSGISVGLWLTFALMVMNLAMIFWLSVVLVSLLELIRLKLTQASRTPRVLEPHDPSASAKVAGRPAV